ncbi:MAG: ATP-binding protein [Nanoarchaeota archaeon]|nr:ATP-binding protein [Nanoarchaeota archaeon]
MDYIIKRKEADLVKSKRQWLLVYGRRKVGKTFLLRELCRAENYYSVAKDLAIISGGRKLSLEEFVSEVKSLLSEGKRVVVDEFQRLNEGVFEEISLLHPKGQLILSGSSMRVIKKVFEPKSPLLGFFMPIKIGFISPSDIISGLKGRIHEDKLIEFATFLREPWVIPSANGGKASDFVYSLITQSKYTIVALVGEIFTEEERELTKKYEAILSLIGSGVWKTKEITAILYSRKLIPEPSPNHLIQYLKNMEEMELVESIKLHKGKERYYRLKSPIMSVYYYMNSRYEIGAREISMEEAMPTLVKLLNLEIQNFIADLFAEIYGGRKEYYVSKDKEVDFVITKRNKAEIIGEVKWKQIGKEDILKFKRNSEGLHGRRVLICMGGESGKDVEVIDRRKLLKLAQRI